jgi:DNA-binding CsgD family transcriptional regulator
VTKAEVAAALLDQVALAAIVVDQAANLVSMNEGARRIVATGDGLVVRNGRLVAVGARGNARFQECLKAVVERATDGPSFPGVAFSLERRGGNTPLEIFVVPSRPTIAQTRSSGRLIAVLIRDPDAGFSPPPEWLATLYDLTRMEAQVAVWLAVGKTISEIAEAMHLSIHTIRSYVKDIFFKMGVRRQSDLVRRLMAGPGLMRAAVDGTIVPEAAAGTAVEKRAPAVSYG